jgi:uncharacterized protein
MNGRLLHEHAGERTFVVVLETGEEAVEALLAFVTRERIGAAQIVAIGAFSDAVIGYFDWEKKDYRPNSFVEQLEVASLLGDVAMSRDGKPAVHVHVVLGRRDGTAVAGHLLSGHVRPTLEVILTESPAHLQKIHDPQSGLALIRPDRDSPARREPRH